MAEHTPGPWRDEITEEGELVVIRGDGSKIYIGDMETTTGEDHADAAAIALVPDFLAFCKHALSQLEAENGAPAYTAHGCNAHNFVEPLKALLAKAEPWK